LSARDRLFGVARGLLGAVHVRNSVDDKKVFPIPSPARRLSTAVLYQRTVPDPELCPGSPPRFRFNRNRTSGSWRIHFKIRTQFCL